METELFALPQNIRVMYVQAMSLKPQAIQDAFNVLEEKAGGGVSEEGAAWRKYLDGFAVYGKTGMLEGQVVYRACVQEQFEGQGLALGLPSDVIPSGAYNSFVLENWITRMQDIRVIFEQLLSLPNTDMAAGCFEYYISEQKVRLFVKRK